MKTAALWKTAPALPLIAMLALAGCGGGGGGGTAGGPQTPGTGGGQTPTTPAPLTPATGLTASDHTPAPDYASSSNHTMAELLPDPTNSFAPITSSLRMDYDNDVASITDSFHVKSISSDGNNGFHITYVIGGLEKTIHFSESDYRTSNRDYRTSDENGVTFTLWSYTDSIRGSDKNRGSSEFAYFDAFGNYLADIDATGADGRALMTYGARTSTLPGGTATYYGRTYSDMFDNTVGNLSNNTARTRILGRLALTASFADATVQGRIWGLRMRPPGALSYENLPLTTQIDIKDGRIVDGRFTASLSGTDEDPNAPLDKSARGFEGDAYGEFYGPAAEELGGVLNAVRAEDNMTVSGWFGGSKGRDIAIDSSAQLSSLVNRNYPNSQTSIGTSDSAMVETTTDGYRITFAIDGVEKSVDVTEADLGGIGGNTYNFEKVVDTAFVSRRFYLWRYPGDFPGRPKFDYLDVNGVILSDYTPGSSQDDVANLNDVTSGYIVRGTRTSASDMPTGSASYSGEMHAREWPTDVLSSYTDADEYRGDFNMAANFAAGTVTGTVSNVDSRPSWRGTYTSSPSTGLTFQGAVAGNSITASSLSGTGAFAGYSGSAEGAFYGPNAAEVGGVIEASATNKLLQGYFAGDKQ